MTTKNKMNKSDTDYWVSCCVGLLGVGLTGLILHKWYSVIDLSLVSITSGIIITCFLILIRKNQLWN